MSKLSKQPISNTVPNQKPEPDQTKNRNTKKSAAGGYLLAGYMHALDTSLAKSSAGLG